MRQPSKFDLLSVKARLKRVLSLIPIPGWTARYPESTRLEKYKVSALCRILLAETGHMVFGGPFSTMKLVQGSTLAADPRMIVGSYEQEVHDVLNRIIASAPTNIIDIGAAYGYYAVGLAMKIAKANVVAFEAVEEAHWTELAALARLNGVDARIIQRGLCTPKHLLESCLPGSFILSDCEGAEEDLLNPSEIPALRSCTILIELHEFHRSGLVGILVDRFKESHFIRLLDEAPRDPSRYRILKRLPQAWRPVAIQEVKWISDQSSRTTTWLRFMVLTPK